jgi:hypothetical protein
MMDTFNGALTLNQTMMRGMREAPDAVRRGLMVVLLVGLLVGGVEGIQLMLTTADPQRTTALFSEQYDAFEQQLGLSANAPELRELLRVLDANQEGVVRLVGDVAGLPAALPRPISAALQGLGLMASRPLSYLSGLLLAVVFTHIAARQLGGQGSIQQMLSLGALSVAPHALDALGFIPGLGGALQLIAFFWGLAILVTATGIAHKLDSGRATLAVLLYPLIGGLLGLLACCAIFFLLIAAGAGA